MLPLTIRSLIADTPVPDWTEDSTVAIAVAGRLGPLLWAAVNSGKTQVSPASKQQLAIAELYWTAQRAVHVEAIAGVRQAFANADVPMRLYKGLANAQMLYDSPAHRPSADVDIVVSTSDEPGLYQAMTEIGFPSHQASALLHLAHQGRPLHEAAVGALNGGVNIDLHFNVYGLLTRPRVQDLGPWFRETSHPDLGDLLVPTPELALVVSAVNLTRKGGSSLISACDVVRLTQGVAGAIDWDKYDELVESDGLRSICTQSLWAVADDLQIELPIPLSRPHRRAWWAPRLGRQFVRVVGQPTLLPLHRPPSFWGESFVAAKRWYFPSTKALEAMGEPGDDSAFSRSARRLTRKISAARAS